MQIPGRGCAALIALLLVGERAARAQDFALTKDSELGFQRLIHAAETGQLGDDATDANVSVLRDRVRVEIILADGTTKALLLTHKGSSQTFSRYFDIVLGEGATPSDARRVGNVLDEAFRSDPFVVSLDYVGATATDRPTMRLAEAWKYGTWKIGRASCR